jgi:ABC-type antimicrobial peptide transport system permease subunit
MFGAPVLREVVGVVDDVHQTALTDAPAAVYYTPFAQDPKPALTLLVSSDRDAGAVVSVVRSAVRSIDVEQPITRTATMDELLSDSVARLRFLLRLIGLIATVALLVALCGVYATMAATVEERRGEIGVRMALGARATPVVRMVLWDGGRYIIAGTVIGVPLLLASRRFFEGFLFGVRPDDPRVLAVVCLVVLVAALAGLLQPARTATRVDPATVLRR